MPLLWTGVPPGALGSAFGSSNAVAGGNLQQIAQRLLLQYGWSGQWPAFNALENREAGWLLNARNASSGAYGLAQFIDGPGEYAQYGGDATTGLGQLTAMMNYIHQRYGSPNAAWGHETAFGWYGNGFSGDVNRPTIFGAGEAGREHVEITPAGKTRSGTIQNFYITTQEIDPRKHAADLGWELARRSS
jgi:SLT domain-containing protein